MRSANDGTATGRAVLVVLLAAVGVAVHAPESSSAAVDLAKKPGAVRSVPMQYRPKWRWWWPTGAVDPGEVDRELTAMKAAGFGGVEQVLLRSPGQWWLPEFRAATKHAVQKATSLGMKFDATLGPEWPISSKAVDDEVKGLSMQEAMFSDSDVVGPSVYAGPPPQLDDNGNRPRTLVAVTAAQPVNQADPGVADPVAGGIATPVRLDPKTAIDLTPQVKNGVLTWQVPPGRWKLVATWMRPTGQRVHGDAVTLAGAVAQSNLPTNLPDLGGQLGPLVPDHFSRAAIDATLGDFDRTLFGGDMAGVLRRNGGHVFEDSLELAHDTASIPLPGANDGCVACNGRFWTPRFLKEFRTRRGYDLTPLLPAIFGAFDLPDGGGTRVRNDYYQTLSDLLIDNHYKPIRSWANRHGLKSRAQGYNLQGTDKTYVSSKLQLPDGESLDFGDTGNDVAPGSPKADAVLDDYRQIVSGAHLSGAKQISLEAGANTAGEYDMSVDDYKPIADRAFASGMTTMVLHGFAYRSYQDPYQTWSWPGWSAFNFLFAESWNQAHPAFAQWRGLAGYYGRIGAALQNGKPRVDVTVLSSQTSPHVYGSKDVADALRGGGYTWDRIDDASLSGVPQAKRRRILPNGPGYRALVIDSMPSLSQAVAEKALSFGKRGVPVVIKGDVPAHGTSYRDANGEDAAIKAAFDQLLRLPNVRRVASGSEVVGALTQLRVPPELRRGNLPVAAQHRKSAGGDVWFLYNNSAKPAAGIVTFATRGAPAQIDPWTGRATELGAYNVRRGTVSLRLRLAAGQTTLISFNRRARKALHARASDGDVIRAGRRLMLTGPPGRRTLHLSNGQRRKVLLHPVPAPITVGGAWALHVETAGPDGPGKVDLTLDKLDDWRDIPQLAGSSGIGTYVTQVRVPRTWIRHGRRLLLDPGPYGGFAQVAINGKRAPLPGLPDGGRDVTPLLRPGKNQLCVRIATTVTNVIVAHARGGDSRYAIFAKNSPQPYGLLGPVRLVPFARAGIRP